MDRPLDRTELNRRRLRRGGATLALVALVVASGAVIWAWARPSVEWGSIRTAVVERGPVEAATLCSGTVVPATEQVIPCPFDSRVERVLERPGARVVKGQALVELDGSEVGLAVERLEDEIALKRNRRRELGLELERRRSELVSRREIEQERINFLEARTAEQRTLHKHGLTPVYALRQAELDESIARIQLRQLGEELTKERERIDTAIEGLGIEESLLRRDLERQRRELERATVRADRDGVVTWVSDEEGASIRAGAVVARLADLSRFRVDATVSDVHVNRMAMGMPVRVEVGGATLGGRVTNIPPVIDRGIMTLEIELDDPSSELLRASLRVDVHVITASRPDALRLSKGPFVNGAGRQQVFVVRGDHAVRTEATLGAVGVDHYEVLSGLAEGDRVIVSNMADRLHTERIRLKGKQGDVER